MRKPHWQRHLLPHPHDTENFDLALRKAESLVHSWKAHWHKHPDRAVLHAPDGGWRTGAQLEKRSREIAEHLWAAGLRPGERVFLSAASSGALVETYIALHRVNAIVVPVNTAYQEPEIAHILQDATPSLAIVDSPTRATQIRRIRLDTQVFSPAGAGATAETDRLFAPIPTSTSTDSAILDTATGECPAVLCYTSGTTGRPKGALLTHANLVAAAESLRIAWRWSPQDRLALALPLFHMHGLGIGLHGTLHAGASMVLLPNFDIDLLLDAIRDHNCSLFFGVPTMYQRLAQSARAHELSALRLCVSGSAPLPPDLFNAIEEQSNQRILERYGLTETLMNLSNPYHGERRPGTVGFPLPGVEVRLDTAEGQETGEILVRGPNVFSGYWNRPDATASAFDDGWFRTGDLGQCDETGYFRIVGRAKELIISGGYNVYPREVEEALREHPAVGDAAVIGRPSKEWGETVIAFVEQDAHHNTPNKEVAPETALTKELSSFVAERLAPYKRPKAIYWVQALPRNALGKVTKHRLASPDDADTPL